MLVGLPAAQAADTTLTLACKGTVTVRPVDKSEATSTSIIVDLAAKTVRFSNITLSPFPIEVTTVDEMTIVFDGSRTTHVTQWVAHGHIDRVTGDFDMISTLTGKMEGDHWGTLESESYTLKCRPAQRMF
jgi:hypothetical protein